MLHLLAMLATTYVQVCRPDLPVGNYCVIDGHVLQFRCAVTAPREFTCSRRIKRSAMKPDVHI